MHMAIVFFIGLAIVGLIAILAMNSESRRRRARESTPENEAWSAGRTESSGIEQWMLYSMLSNQNHHHHRHHHNDQPADPSGGYGGAGYDAGGVSGGSGWPDGPGWGGNDGGFPADGGGLADGTGTTPDPR
ncbi:hypothetical protein ACQP06_30125 [Nocardia sp. CA-136227]|uniref:hypothetical protein n=1 Tax=Nocardia sp. CA-136227 TaxID=3239979 RepID=UPI003D95C713